MSKERVFGVVKFWHERKNSFGKCINLNQPTCWACEQGWEGRYDVKTNQYASAWKKAPLQICHVVPKSLGGGDQPSNLVLMCKECHDLAPNTNLSEVMYEWMRKQSYLLRLFAKTETAIDDFGIRSYEPKKLESIAKSPEFKAWALKNANSHWPQSGYSGFSHKATISTCVGLLKYYLDNHTDLDKNR